MDKQQAYLSVRRSRNRLSASGREQAEREMVQRNLERNDSNIIGTSAGAIAVGSVCCLSKEQIDAAILEEMQGLP